MTNRCTFKQGLFNCGSHAFNLYKENIEQGDYCDHHYWEDQAKKAAAQEREECAKLCMAVPRTGAYFAWLIRARGTT